jgi:hypothetical protein
MIDLPIGEGEGSNGGDGDIYQNGCIFDWKTAQFV